jgi:hypothetical protein
MFRCTVLNKGGHAIFFVSPQSANLQILGLIPQSQVRKFLRCASPHRKIRKFGMINPQIANSRICKEKSSVSDPNWLLDYEMPCNSKLSQNQKSSLNLNDSILSLYL